MYWVKTIHRYPPLGEWVLAYYRYHPSQHLCVQKMTFIDEEHPDISPTYEVMNYPIKYFYSHPERWTEIAKPGGFKEKEKEREVEEPEDPITSRTEILDFRPEE